MWLMKNSHLGSAQNFLQVSEDIKSLLSVDFIIFFSKHEQAWESQD